METCKLYVCIMQTFQQREGYFKTHELFHLVISVRNVLKTRVII